MSKLSWVDYQSSDRRLRKRGGFTRPFLTGVFDGERYVVLDSAEAEAKPRANF